MAEEKAQEKSQELELQAACLGCERQVPVTAVGVWCDACGGVAIRPGDLLLRHVATVDGVGGRFAIVFDKSTSDYSVTVPVPTPRAKAGKRDLDGFLPPPFTTFHGPLDLVIAMAQPYARGPKGPNGEAPELPELFAAPTTTPEEKAILEVGA